MRILISIIVSIALAGCSRCPQSRDVIVDPNGYTSWVLDFDHLEPSFWQGYEPLEGAGKQIMQFRQPFTGSGSSATFGWEIYEKRNSKNIMILHHPDGTVTKVDIQETEMIDRIHSFWVNQLVKTRYPDIEGDNNVISFSVDGFSAEFVGYTRGLGDIFGKAYSRLDNSGPGIMTRLGFELHRLAREGYLNNEVGEGEISNILDSIQPVAGGDATRWRS